MSQSRKCTTAAYHSQQEKALDEHSLRRQRSHSETKTLLISKRPPASLESASTEENKEEYVSFSGSLPKSFFKLPLGVVPDPTMFYRKTVLAILSVMVLLERLAFYQIYAILLVELQIFLDTFNMQASIIETQSMLFTGVCYFLPLFGGLISCGFTGRYLSIVVGSLIYLAGSGLLVIDCPPLLRSNATLLNRTTISADCKWQLGLLYIPLLLIAIGGALQNTALYPFIVQQATFAKGENKPLIVEKVFAWVYSLFGLSEVAALGMSFVTINPTQPFTPPVVAIISMTLFVVLFVAGTKLYVRQATKRSVLKDIAFLIKRRLRKRWRRSRLSVNLKTPLLGKVRRNLGVKQSISIESVFAVKQLGRVLPVFAVLLVYLCLLSQMTAIVSRDLRNVTYRIPRDHDETLMRSSQYVLIGQVSIQVLNAFITPLVYFVLYPLFRRFKVEPHFYKKIGVGNVILIASLIISVVVEFIRHYSTISPTGSFTYNMIMDVFVSLSETIVIVSALTFSYLEAPVGLEDVFFGLFLCSNGIGFLVGAGMFSLSKASPDMAEHQEYYMLVLIFLLVLNSFLILYLSRKQSPSAASQRRGSTDMQTLDDQSQSTDSSIPETSVSANPMVFGTSGGKAYQSVVSW